MKDINSKNHFYLRVILEMSFKVTLCVEKLTYKLILLNVGAYMEHVIKLNDSG